MWLYWAGGVLCTPMLAAGCAAVGGAWQTVQGWVGLGEPPKVKLRQLRIVSDADANARSACRIDVVAVHQAQALALLPALAPQWFAQRQALQDGLGTALTVRSFEIPPATLIERAELPEHTARALAVRVYVDLQSPTPQHVVDVGSHAAAVLHLTARAVTLSPEH